MKRTLRVLPDAAAELQSAATWFEEKRGGLDIGFVAVVDRAFQSVVENPEACYLQQMGSCLEMIRKPLQNDARYERVWQEVHGLKDEYEMSP